jgi:hypothetical protein
VSNDGSQQNYLPHLIMSIEKLLESIDQNFKLYRLDLNFRLVRPTTASSTPMDEKNLLSLVKSVEVSF